MRKGENKKQPTSKRIKRDNVKDILKVQCAFSATFVCNCSQSSGKSSPNGLVIIISAYLAALGKKERKKERRLTKMKRGKQRQSQRQMDNSLYKITLAVLGDPGKMETWVLLPITCQVLQQL